MSAYQTNRSPQGTKSVRMEQRTTQQAKELIERAASLLGVNASEFTVAAAVRVARETLRDYENTALQLSAHAAFMKAMDSIEPTPDLVALMKLHGEVSKAK